MGQHRGHLTPEERARIIELQDLLIDRFLEHRGAAADGQEERIKTLEAEIDDLLREKEEVEKWATVDRLKSGLYYHPASGSFQTIRSEPPSTTGAKDCSCCRAGRYGGE